MISARAVTFAFGDEPVVGGVDLRAGPGEVVALLGPSGCGKTTLLRLVAGLLTPSEGSVERPAASPGRAAMSFVFQDPRLLPWMTVRQNLNFALEAAAAPRGEWIERTRPLLAQVGLEGVEGAYPQALSGGMAQRVALVRALSLRPHALLMDEPFAAVDPLLRERLQEDLQALLAGGDTAGVLVTHSIPEALALGDEVLVLSPRPARVLDRLRVDAARPRGAAWRISEAARALEIRIRDALTGPAPASGV